MPRLHGGSSLRRGTHVAVAVVVMLATTPASADATFVINNLDPAGQGFNDPTPLTPVGGNPATTVGQARLNAFRAATDIWSSLLDSRVPIKVDAHWGSLPCSSDSGSLGSAGALYVYQNFPNAPRAQTSYASALANALAGKDLSPTNSDIDAYFNSDVGTSDCLASTGWYYGLDGASPSNKIDFVTILAHELAHGLGFATYIDVTTGAKLGGLDDSYLLDLEQYGATPPELFKMTDAQRVLACKSEPSLLWTGPLVTAAALTTLTAGLNHNLVELYGPAPVVVDSSVSHFSASILPSQLMAPSYVRPLHDTGLAIDLLRDMGWPVPSPPSATVVVPATPLWAHLLLAAGLLGAVGIRKRRASTASK